MKKPAFADLYKLSEDKRIDLIGHYVMHEHKVTAFIVEDQEKADRYIGQLKTKFPGIVVDSHFPWAGQIVIKLRPPA